MGGADAVRRFRPRWNVIPLVVVCGLPFALLAAFAPWSEGPRKLGWWVGLVMAGSAAFCGVRAVGAIQLSGAATASARIAATDASATIAERLTGSGATSPSPSQAGASRR